MFSLPPLLPPSFPHCIRLATSRRENGAFTLVELLTVIAIIGILAAIIIPTVGKVRESARTAVCASNLRQTGAAIMLWGNDNKGLYLPSRVAGMGGMFGTQYWNWYGSAYSTGKASEGLSPLAGYMGMPTDVDNGWKALNRITICPLARSDSVPAAPADLLGAYGYPYVANYWIMAHPTAAGRKPVPMSSVGNPSSIVMLAEGMSDSTWGLGISDHNNLARVGELHGGKANVLWADAHVTLSKKADIAVAGKINPDS
ncbi:MAG: prepilin-type N-terminal cleavage/methylation domain-containing protein [Opitutaceae bacterium]|nr:prepilin-type N-terminal cleavage/methylation domain-containing protein [Opitutaceae bacterium]